MRTKKGLFCKGVMLGAFIGGIATLFHKGTRDQMKQRASEAASSTIAFARTVKEDPNRVKQQVKDTSDNVRTIASEINKEIKDVIDTFQEVKAHSQKTYQSFKETGGELKELGGKLRESAAEVKKDGDQDLFDRS